jgi:hypothetical protein
MMLDADNHAVRKRLWWHFKEEIGQLPLHARDRNWDAVESSLAMLALVVSVLRGPRDQMIQEAEANDIRDRTTTSKLMLQSAEEEEGKARQRLAHVEGRIEEAERRLSDVLTNDDEPALVFTADRIGPPPLPRSQKGGRR